MCIFRRTEDRYSVVKFIVYFSVRYTLRSPVFFFFYGPTIWIATGALELLSRELLSILDCYGGAA